MIDTTQMPDGMKEKLFDLCGDNNAVNFMADIWQVAQTWDDLIDHSKTNDDQINYCFESLLLRIPLNVFYRKNIDDLSAMILQTILDWKTANVMEKADDEQLNRAYMLRAGIYRLFHYCIYLTKGYETASKSGQELWSIYGETLKDFKREYKKNA